jgi:multidrug efflux pump subunit AcrB
MGIVRFALKFPYTFYVLAAFILFLGVSAIMVMPEDIFPEIDIPVVSVIWQYTGLSVPEMEQRVTTYSQYAMSTSAGHPGADRRILQCLERSGAAAQPQIRPSQRAAAL